MRSSPKSKSRFIFRVAVGAAALLAGALGFGPAAPRDNPAAPLLRPAGKLPGSLILVGGGQLAPAIVDKFLELAGGESARIVIIRTTRAGEDSARAAALIDSLRRKAWTSLDLLDARTGGEPSRAESMIAKTREATGAVIESAGPEDLELGPAGGIIEIELKALIARGGVVLASGGAAGVVTRVAARGEYPWARAGRGIDLLPGAIVDHHFLGRNRLNRLIALLEANPGLVGFGISEATALVIQGRRINVVGRSYVTTVLSPGGGRPARIDVLKPGSRADLVQLSRAAIARARPAYPSREGEVPEVPSGTLVIVGGGRVGPEILDRFIKAAGGPEAPIVVIPTAGGDTPPPNVRFVGTLREAGAKNVRVLHATSHDQVETPEFLDALREAKGVWFTGGRQWRLVDAYAETSALGLFRDILARGGVIGGSSAGASIQAGYMVRGSPMGNREMMAEGYERGFNFLPGAAVDQHFTQRTRQPHMTELMRVFPQLLGIGIDESTAIVIRGHEFEVIGPGNVSIYDWIGEAPSADGPDHATLSPGTRYDMKARIKLEPADE